jgi:signal transduction histidine kinase
MEAIGQLAGGIAHDFNNILTSMFGYGYLLQQDLAENPSGLENISEILKAAKRAQDLVKQILTFSRQHENTRQIVLLKTVIEEAMKFLRASLPANIKIEMNLADNVPAVLADPTQIYQVTMNLATNALHAMEGRPGRLAISLDSFHPDEEFIRTHPQFRFGAYVRLMVADTGHGMDAKTLEHIFEPFFTTKAVGKGTGLGLAVVHGVVQSHNGIITVESQPGQGTTFSLYFPAHAPRTAVNAAKNSNAVPGHGERILLVDDETS